MEKLINTNLVIHINYIKSIKISDERCVIYADAVDFGAIKILFDDVWDCRYTIENGIIDRSSKMLHCEEEKSSIYEVVDSQYIQYFMNQVSETRPTSNLKDYIIFDDVENVFEILSINAPRMVQNEID